jgi:Ca2+/Na+ antiporter
MRQHRDMTRFEIHSLYQMKRLARADRPALVLLPVICLMFLALAFGAISAIVFDIVFMVLCLCASIWLAKLRGTLARMANERPPA